MTSGRLLGASGSTPPPASFTDGLQALPDAIAATHADAIALDTTVTGIEPAGAGYALETDAGTVRGLLAGRAPAVGGAGPELADAVRADASEFAVGRAVQVSVRADTVTLHATSSSPKGSATSARNRFSGTVVEIDSGESITRVAVDVGASTPLVALVTNESLDRLDLEPGMDVVAAFKSTATWATAIE
jgi:molybdate transport system regulatory protein